jgi:hypothetical protein
VGAGSQNQKRQANPDGFRTEVSRDKAGDFLRGL